ncbi:MAG TPA: efflux RND transporter permease subunit [Spirochaetia bacterium]|nr:efflux RND transporter permease subunit [Spirochaetia bacterium]
MRIADYSINHGPTVIVAIAAAVVFGVIALTSIPQERTPDVAKPSILIVTQYPGVGPRDVERQITKPIEDVVSTVSGVTKVTSDSRDSFSIITLEFNWNENVDTKFSSLREKVNTVISDLPSGITGPPEFFSFTASDLPVLTYVVRSSGNIQEVRRYLTDQVVPFFERVPGVASVSVSGVPEEEVKVSLDLADLANRHISPVDVLHALQANNVTIPAGNVEFRGSSLNVRSVGEFSSLDQIRDMVVGVHGGTFVRLRDIAGVNISDKKRDLYTVANGKDVLVIDVKKQRGTDTISIIEQVNRAAKQVEGREQGQIQFYPITDQSVDIHRSVQSVANSALLGALLAVVILFLVLHNLRSTLVVAVSIPLSVVIGIIGLYMSGRSLNLVTLGGLTVAIGMVVDNSIVVLENSYKHIERGTDPAEAASRGTTEVVGAVIASTVTSLAVFVPILFVQGFVGIILRDVSLAVIFALTASLVVAVFVVPFLFSRVVHLPKRKLAISQMSEGVFTSLEKAYSHALAWCLDNTPFVIGTAVIVLFMSVGALNFLGAQFLPDTDTSQIIMTIDTPPGYSLARTKQKIVSIDALTRRLVPEIESTLFYVGEANLAGIGNSNTATRAVISLLPSERRQRSIFQIISLLRKEIPATIPDVRIEIQNGGIGAIVASAIGSGGLQIDVSGSDFEHVRQAADRIAAILAADRNVSAVRQSVQFDREDLVEQFDKPVMSQLGVLPSEAALTSRIILNGVNAGTYRASNNDYTINLTSNAAGGRITGNLLNEMSVKTAAGSFVDFSAFTTLRTEPSYSDIPHLEKLKSISVSADLINPDVRGTSARATTQIGRLTLPPDVRFQIAGQAQQMQSSFKSLGAVLLIAVFLVYIVMVIQFQRFAQPLIIMGSIPFIFIGAVASLLIFGSNLSIIAFLGLITLAGTVVNNAIVLVDYMNMLRRDYQMPLREAVLDGGRLRLRPILMTTLTTILGVIPMALALGEGSSLNAPLGQVIGGGLLTSTLITLFLIPTLYWLLERRVERSRS